MRTRLAGSSLDIRSCLRGLLKTPAFTAGAIVTVALAVGATTAVFTLVYGVLLRQLPYRDAHEVFWIWSDQPGRDRTPFNVPDFIDYRDSVRTLSGLAGFFAVSANLSDESAAERIQGLRATGNFFEVLGATARIGRLLQSSDEEPGADPVVVLAEPFWVRRFGEDPSIIGRTIRLNGEPHTVVGVVSAGFVTIVRDADFVLPFAPDLDARRSARNSLNFIIGVGRLAAGVTRSQAASDLNAMAGRLQERFPVENARKRGVRLVAVLEGVVGSVRTTLLTGLAAVATVLLIACANLANLMLTRASNRRKTIAVLLALGASRLSVGRQALVEALLVSLAGGVIGVFAARAGVAGLLLLMPSELPRAGDVRMDWMVVLFSVGMSTVTGLLFGVVPALAAARSDVRDALHGSGRGTTAGGRITRGVLVSAEVALAVTLLTVMTLLAKSFSNVQEVRPGFDASGVLTARLTLPSRRFQTPDAIVTFQGALASAIAQVPGVTRSGAISLLPLSGLVSRVPFTVEGRATEREHVPAAQYRMVSPGYFETTRIAVLRGRSFTDQDSAASRAVAVVSESLVARWLDGRDPIGTRLLVDDNDVGPRPIEIIGVVADVRQTALDGDATWDLYVTYPQIPRENVGLAAANMFWVVRTETDPPLLAASIASAVRRVDPEVATSQLWPMGRYLSEAVAPRRFSLTLLAIFSLAALALAVTGIHAVVAYSVSQRQREIGIRVALGASRGAIIRLVMADGTRFVVLGLTAGVALALAASRVVAATLFGLTPGDPGTLVQVVLLMAGVSLLACALPATRVARAAGPAIHNE